MYSPRLTHLLFGLATFVLVNTSQLAHAEDRIERLLEISGAEEAIERFPEHVKAGIRSDLRTRAGVDPELVYELERSADRSIRPDIIMAEIRRELRAQLSDADLDQLLSWYESEVGQRILEAEKRIDTPEGQEKMQRMARTLLGNTTRVQTVRRLDHLSGTSAAAVEVQRSLATAIVAAVELVAKPDQAPDLARIRAELSRREQEVRSGIQQAVTVTFLYAYLTVDDDALAAYEAFQQTPAAQRYRNAGIAGMQAGLERVTSDWTQELAALFRRRTEQGPRL